MERSTKRLAVSLVALLAMLALFAALSAAAQGVADSAAPIINPAIDEGAYLRTVEDALGHRAERRLSEADFIRMSREPGTIVLDARSKARFDELHVALGTPLHVRIYHKDKLIDEVVAPYQRTFGEVPIGKPLVYVNSLLNIAVALNQRSYAAAHKIGSGPGWSIEVAKN